MREVPEREITPLIVMKFGGTSVGDATAIRRVGEIIRSRLDRRPVVVVSAVSRTTDRLIALCHAASKGEEGSVQEKIEAIIDCHSAIIADLDLTRHPALDSTLQQVGAELTEACQVILEGSDSFAAVSDGVLSLGELLSTRILAAYLNALGLPAVAVDVREILLTDCRHGKAQPLPADSSVRARRLLLPLLEQRKIPILQGFVGRSQEGRTTTLGRGGSDFSATLIGAMLAAEAVEIWSDVDGVLTADPSIVPEARRIRSMSFQEAAELAYFGAKVLHPATLLPAVNQNIPVYVLNSMRPADSGTAITSQERPARNGLSLVKSIAYREGVSIVTVISTRMLMAHGFMSSIFEVFDRYRTAVDLVSTSEVSVSMTVDNAERLEDICRELRAFSQVDVQHGKAVVCVVGENMRRAPGMPARIFRELEDIPIHVISQGASEINISFVIDEADVPAVVRRLHEKLFTGFLDHEVFVTAARM